MRALLSKNKSNQGHVLTFLLPILAGSHALALKQSELYRLAKPVKIINTQGVKFRFKISCIFQPSPDISFTAYSECQWKNFSGMNPSSFSECMGFFPL